jgi:hypothetical protein
MVSRIRGRYPAHLARARDRNSNWRVPGAAMLRLPGDEYLILVERTDVDQISVQEILSTQRDAVLSAVENGIHLRASSFIHFL